MTGKEIAVRPRELFKDESDGYTSFGSVLACPVCGFNYTHTTGAATRVGRDAFEAVDSYRGTDAVGVTGERRSALVVTFRCENGHQFALVIQQHKGNNFCHVEQLPDMPEAHTEEIQQFETAWADGERLARIRIDENTATINSRLPEGGVQGNGVK